MKRILMLFLCVLVSHGYMTAQRNCGAMNALEQNLQQDPKLENKMQQIEKATRAFLQKSNTRVNSIITIPVVVHVVYNTSSENISDAQIASQIQILNEDFRRLNSDASNTPSLFQGVASDIEIEFCLATVDPNGNPTNGITRTSTSRTSFGSNDDVKFNSSGGKNAWPASDYMNVWVCDLSGTLLGYAQFPGGSPATDGVVNDYLYFGNIGTATAPFDLGRTMTHEVGHYLNLRHIWGDGNCNADDFVSDTPRAGGANTTGAPCTFPGPNSCNEGPGDQPDMFQNYMDYSDDGCMNLFTAGQKARMRALFDTGGFRASLLSSPACGTPAEPTCSDGIQNGSETGVDCGGPDCQACPPEPSCSDGIQNGSETGVDCGGPDCAPCPCTGTTVVVSITLDNYPEETSWSITNSSGSVVASGGTYGSQPDGSTVTQELCLADGCYDFRINDAYGDGICCAYGSGSYSVNAGGTIVASGGSFGSSETTNFCLGGGPAPTCNDGIQNGSETGVDCGGPDCAPCVTPPTCDDGIQNGSETGVDCGGPDCAPCNPGQCTQTTIDANDFENGYGIWNDGGSDCFLDSRSQYANSGFRSVRLRDNTSSSVVTTDVLNLAGFEEVVIDFNYLPRSMESGEDFWLQASTDGGASYQTLTTWVSGVDFTNDVREFETVTITGQFTSNTRFRFRCDASTNSDLIYLDDIVLTGCVNGSKEARETDAATLETDAQPINLKLFPNPARDVVTVSFNTLSDSQADICIVDMSGRRILTRSIQTTKGKNEVKLPVADFNAGIYYVHLMNDQKQHIEKFVVIK